MTENAIYILLGAVMVCAGQILGYLIVSKIHDRKNRMDVQAPSESATGKVTRVTSHENGTGTVQRKARK